ncbi:MAG: hypothetical protein HQL53_00680 [Magnetococcales bacterium]|nr:hypothetical protein [Magnetococcales bacterium]
MSFDAYKLRFNSSLKQKLQSDEARQYSRIIYEYIRLAIEDLTKRHPELGTLNGSQEKPLENCSGLSSDIRFFFNIHLLQTAIDVAWLDLHYPNEFHDQSKSGPSAARQGAVIMCWLNRIRPVQVCRNINDSWVTFINPLLALHVGLSVTWEMKQLTGVPLEQLAERPEINDLLYMLQWRSPDFKQLTNILQLI